jgi:hypothetical protein
VDQRVLVDEEIDDGKRLLDRLGEEGIAVTAAGWLKESESGWWYLYLATPLVGPDGATRPAYRRVNAVIRQMPPDLRIPSLGIKVIAPDSPTAQAVRELHQRYPGHRPVRLGETRIGDVNVEGAYIYPPVAAPVQ